MNIDIINRRNKIRELRKERDELFSILDEVTYKEQTQLLESIIDLTNKIDTNKKELGFLLSKIKLEGIK